MNAHQGKRHRESVSSVAQIFRAGLWVANVTLLPTIVLVSWLFLSGGAHLPDFVVGVLLIVEMAAGALGLSWLAGSFRYPAFPYRMVVTRMGLGWLFLLPVGLLMWQFVFSGYVPGQ